MRTTVSISDELLIAAKLRARSAGKSLGAVIDDALRRELSAARAERQGPPIPVFRDGTGPAPGVDLTSNRALYELLDEQIPLEQRH